MVKKCQMTKLMKSIKNKPIIGAGMTSGIYEWDDGKVLKLFYINFHRPAAEYEARMAL